jgi:hypothetical protein
MRLGIAPLAGAALLVLGATNAWLLQVVLQPEVLAAAPPVADAAAALSLSEGPGAPTIPMKPAAYPETLAHPVFFKTRAPYVPPPPAPPPVAKAAAPVVAADPGLALGGVALDGALRKAYLFTKANSQGAWVSEGETFNGWTVQSIDAGAAKLRQADRTLELLLYPPASR